MDPVAGTGRRPWRPVGSHRPNGFGLYDVLENVEEWVDDCWNESYEGAPLDGSSWYEGDCTRRMSRGGSWHFSPDGLRSAGRDWAEAGRRLPYKGFRLARRVN